jgi:hypothetical protein
MYFVTLRLNVLTWRTCKRVGKSEKWWSLGSVRSRGLGVTRLRLQRVMDSSLCLQNSWTTGNGQTFPDFGHLQSFHFSHVDWKPASGVRFHGNLGDQETDSPHLVKVPKNQSVSALVSPGFWSFPFLSSHVCRRVLLMSGTATPVLCTLSLGTEGVLQLCQCVKLCSFERGVAHLSVTWIYSERSGGICGVHEDHWGMVSLSVSLWKLGFNRGRFAVICLLVAEVWWVGGRGVSGLGDSCRPGIWGSNAFLWNSLKNEVNGESSLCAEQTRKVTLERLCDCLHHSLWFYIGPGGL